jgi:hypothetical protein
VCNNNINEGERERERERERDRETDREIVLKKTTIIHVEKRECLPL